MSTKVEHIANFTITITTNNQINNRVVVVVVVMEVISINTFRYDPVLQQHPLQIKSPWQFNYISPIINVHKKSQSREV